MKKAGNEMIWDVAVVGGGAAGMMAAGRAAELGAKVILIEKNNSLGKKLLITGGGRCNVTNAEFDTRKLLEKFKESNKFLFSAFSQWAPKETLDFFHARTMPTKTEKELRVFPKSDSARSVWDVLVAYMKEGGVTVLSDSPVAGFIRERADIVSVRIKGTDKKPERLIRAKSFILATGGKSRPETGSTGDGFAWLKWLGHTVVEPKASLVPIAIKDPWVRKLQGVTIPMVKISIVQDGIKHESRTGKLLFTHFGVTGPTILNMSRDIGEFLQYGKVSLTLDFQPTLDPGKLNAKLQELFKVHSNKKLKNVLGELVPSGLVAAITANDINGETFCHSVTREERLALVKLLKDVPMQVLGLLGVNKAVITSGGVSLKEVDTKTMRSLKVPNLYLVGDILHIDRPSGGYSLQLCWTTGYVAGTAAVSMSLRA